MKLNELQDDLPWGAHDYSVDFHANPQPHKHFAHALLHIQKASGRLADLVDGLDHKALGSEHATAVDPAACVKYLADIVICVLRMANEWPGGRLSLARAVTARLMDKFPEWVPPTSDPLADHGGSL